MLRTFKLSKPSPAGQHATNRQCHPRLDRHVPLLPRSDRAHRRAARRNSWRRGWDSNPRTACTVNGFRDRPVRPLRHLSVYMMGIVAERVGFEPTVRVTAHTISSRAPSATRSPLRLHQPAKERHSPPSFTATRRRTPSEVCCCLQLVRPRPLRADDSVAGHEPNPPGCRRIPPSDRRHQKPVSQNAH